MEGCSVSEKKRCWMWQEGWIGRDKANEEKSGNLWYKDSLPWWKQNDFEEIMQNKNKKLTLSYNKTII